MAGNKSKLEDLHKYLGNLNTKDIAERMKKGLEKRKEEKEKRKKDEDERLANIKCPACKSSNKEHVAKRGDNGVYGPGFSSWLIDEYYYCTDCGVMYKDLNKPKENPSEENPSDDLLF